MSSGTNENNPTLDAPAPRDERHAAAFLKRRDDAAAAGPTPEARDSEAPSPASTPASTTSSSTPTTAARNSSAASAKWNGKNPAIRRIVGDIRELAQDSSTQYAAKPLEDDYFTWHFVIRGPKGTDFEGGRYHGQIFLPKDYPFKPPNIVFLTPNGRWTTNMKICLSLSAYHPEMWQPAWGIRTMLEALISFMPTPADGAVGALEASSQTRRRLAKESQTYTHPDMPELLPEGGESGEAALPASSSSAAPPSEDSAASPDAGPAERPPPQPAAPPARASPEAGGQEAASPPLAPQASPPAAAPEVAHATTEADVQAAPAHATTPPELAPLLRRRGGGVPGDAVDRALYLASWGVLASIFMILYSNLLKFSFDDFEV